MIKISSVALFVLCVLIGPGIAKADPLDDWRWRNPLPQGNPLTGATYGNNTFVAVGGYGGILTSPEGVNWTPRPSGTTESLCGVTFGNNSFVAVGGYDAVLISSDGVAWTSGSTGSSETLWGVTHARAGLLTFP